MKKINFKNPIDQLPFLGMDKDQFEKEAIALGYKIFFDPGVVTLQVRSDNEIFVFTKDNKVIKIK